MSENPSTILISNHRKWESNELWVLSTICNILANLLFAKPLLLIFFLSPSTTVCKLFACVRNSKLPFAYPLQEYEKTK